MAALLPAPRSRVQSLMILMEVRRSLPEPACRSLDAGEPELGDGLGCELQCEIVLSQGGCFGVDGDTGEREDRAKEVDQDEYPRRVSRVGGDPGE
eukprot:COSAG06_NODE_316_length_17668_cov_19.142410_18_plen_95_part_00